MVLVVLGCFKNAAGVNRPIMRKLRTTTRHWAVLATKSASSGEAIRNVSRQGFVYYHPKFREPPVRGVRKVAPLFPGYLFVQVTRENWKPLASTRDVRHVFTSGEHPSILPAHEIEQLRSLENSDGYIEPLHTQPPAFRLDESVQARSGIFRDQFGSYQGLAGTRPDRVKVLFQVLGQPYVHEISAYDLERAAA